MEDPKNQVLWSRGYTSLFNIPTANDWYLILRTATEIIMEQGTGLNIEGKYQRLYMIKEGVISVEMPVFVST